MGRGSGGRAALGMFCWRVCGAGDRRGGDVCGCSRRRVSISRRLQGWQTRNRPVAGCPQICPKMPQNNTCLPAALSRRPRTAHCRTIQFYVQRCYCSRGGVLRAGWSLGWGPVCRVGVGRRATVVLPRSSTAPQLFACLHRSCSPAAQPPARQEDSTPATTTTTPTTTWPADPRLLVASAACPYHALAALLIC